MTIVPVWVLSVAGAILGAFIGHAIAARQHIKALKERHEAYKICAERIITRLLVSSEALAYDLENPDDLFDLPLDLTEHRAATEKASCFMLFTNGEEK